MGLLLQFNPLTILDPNVLAIFIAKAYIAILDSLLLIEGLYVSSAREKLNMFLHNMNSFNEVLSARKDFEKRIKFFVNIKLNTYEYYNNIDINLIEAWN